MINKFVLSLSGFGHCTDIKRTPQGMKIKIKVLSEFADDVELECIVDRPLISQLENLMLACRVGEYIVMHFIAHYTQYLQCHVGLTEQDPEQMVQLKGKLMAFKGWLRNGELPPPTSPKEI